MTRRPLLIVADDLTGACDAAGAVVAVGGPVTVHLAPARPAGSGAPHGSPLVVVDLDSRAAPAAAAVERTVDAVTGAAGDVYLKIDSTLRGHVVDTVAAAAGAFRALHPGGRVVVCPAFPARGRVVRGRRVLVDGEALASRVLDELAAVPGIEVADAVTDRDLADLAAAVGDAPTLWAGSAGLAPHVAARSSSVLGPDSAPRGAESGPRTEVGSVAVVVGSNQAVSAAGAAAVAARADARVRVLVGDPRQPSFADEAADAVEASDALVVTGGYTARRLLDRLGITALQVGGEIERGIPWSVAGPLTVVTKAGGFGDAGTLGRLVDRLLSR